VRIQYLLILLLTATLLTACTRERPTPEPTATPAASAAPTRTSSEPVVEMVGAPTAATPVATLTPTATPASGVSGALIQYTVQSGDTIGSIAAQFNVTQQQLRELNNLPNDDIFAGQILRVPEGEPTPTPEPFKHVVKSGETLTTIAAQYGVNYLTLVEVNGLESPDNLVVGAELLIPGVAAPDAATTADAPAAGQGSGAATTSGVIHIVQPGETLSTIAADYGVDAAALAAANSLTNLNMLRVGQQLFIPGVTEQQALAARGVRHTVASGESLSQIAQNYGVTVAQIMAANGLDDPNTIVVGQELLIPQE